MPRDLIVVGTSGLAKEMAQLARQIDPEARRWGEIRYVAEHAADLGEQLPYGRVCHTDDDLRQGRVEGDVVIGIGHAAARRRVCSWLRSANPALQFPNLVCPGLVIDPVHVQMGIGNVFTRGVVTTLGIRIGDFNLFNWNATIGHDATIGSYCVVNPGAAISGFCTIGDASLIGAGAVVIEHVRVCDGSTIGAGAVLTHDITEAGVYVGVPARRRA